jgi:hypothetical protein
VLEIKVVLAKEISYNSERAASRGKEIQKKAKDLVEHASFIFANIIGSVAQFDIYHFRL